MEIEDVDEALLKVGVAYHIGSCDKTGHPLVIFPSESQQTLTDLPSQDLSALFHYFCSIVSVKQRLNGFGYVINLQRSSVAVILKVVQALHQLQGENNSTVAVLYAVKPKSSKNAKYLEKITGMRESKKNPVRKTFQVHLVKDISTLHRSIDKAILPEEFGGHLRINIQAWVDFRQKVDGLTTDVSRCQQSLEEVKDKMQIMSEYELPITKQDTTRTVETINSRYNDIIGNLKLEHIIDKCSSIMEELNVPQNKYVQGDMLRDLVLYFRTSQKELTDVREQLQQQWRQAQARLVQASQLQEHKKRANKIIKWITRTGNQTIKKLNAPIKDKSTAADMVTLVKELTDSWQSIQQESEYILTDVEFMALQNISEFQESLVSINRMKVDTETFIEHLGTASNRVHIAEAVLINVDKGMIWYSRVLASFPDCSGDDAWLDKCRTAMLKFTDSSPSEDDLTQLSTNLCIVDDTQFQEKSTTLIKRIKMLVSMAGSEKTVLSPHIIRVWKESAHRGLSALGEMERKSKLTKSVSRSHSSTPKLKKSFDKQTNDSSTDDGHIHKPRTKKGTPTANQFKTSSSKVLSPKEHYVDISKSMDAIKLPHTLSHVDMQKFLQHEPTGKGLRKARSKRRGLHDDDDTDDTCPITSSEITRNSPRFKLADSDIPPPPQIPRLPYNPLTHQQLLDSIISSSAQSAQEKLNMMVELLESGDERCFEVHRTVSPQTQQHNEITAAHDTISSSRLSASNLSNEMTANVTYPERIYHWLKKQDESMEIALEEDSPEAKGDASSVIKSIQKAEALLQQGIPNFTNFDQDYAHRFDAISKSGDSGITDLTAREIILSHNTKRTISKESGMDSDMTACDELPSGSGRCVRPKGVPPLYLKKKHHKQEDFSTNETASGSSALNKLKALCQEEIKKTVADNDELC